MEVTFKTRKLEKQYEKSDKAIRAYGDLMGRKYVQRINIIKQAQDVDELCKLPGLHCHPLKGDRDGQWAVNLTRNYRLIFILEGDKLQIASIREVTDYHDD
jgi:plasmid maintenance system killer protein